MLKMNLEERVDNFVALTQSLERLAFSLNEELSWEEKGEIYNNMDFIQKRIDNTKEHIVMLSVAKYNKD